MEKKNKKTEQNQRLYALAYISMTLNNELKNHANNGNNKSNNGYNNGENTFSVLANKATFVQMNPSFVGYLKASFILFKKAFDTKKCSNFVVIR